MHMSLQGIVGISLALTVKLTLQMFDIMCRHASELRARLDQTAQARAQLVSAVETLQRSSRQEDATAVRQAIEAGQASGGGGWLLEDVASAQQALQRWQLAADNEAKLAKALSNGTSVLALSRAVQVCPASTRNAWAHDICTYRHLTLYLSFQSQ